MCPDRGSPWRHRSRPARRSDEVSRRTAGGSRCSRNDLKTERSRWVGIGSTDACGLSWAFDLAQDGDKVSGHLLWETVPYDLSGTLAPNGRLQKARLASAPDFTGIPGPRFVAVSLEFGARRAVGYDAAETQSSDECATAVELDRYAAE